MLRGRCAGRVAGDNWTAYSGRESACRVGKNISLWIGLCLGPTVLCLIASIIAHHNTTQETSPPNTSQRALPTAHHSSRTSSSNSPPTIPHPSFVPRPAQPHNLTSAHRPHRRWHHLLETPHAPVVPGHPGNPSHAPGTSKVLSTAMQRTCTDGALPHG